jgi:transposase
MLYFSGELWYNICMEKIRNTTTSNTEMVSISRAEYEKQQGYISELERQVQWLMEQLNLARQKKFGASSEHASPEVLEQMSLLFDEPEAVASVAAAEAAPAVEVRPHKRRKSGSVKDILPEDIEVVEVSHGLSEEERKCPQCGETMACIGKEVRNELKLIPAKAVLYQHVYYTYACENCEKKDVSTPVVKTPMEPALVPGGFASAEAVAHVMTQKYVMGVPLYRQEQDWNRRGVMLSRQTMANWLIRCANDWLTPVYDVLHEGLVKHDYLHADETPVQVLREPGRKATADSYMWLYRTGRGAEHPIVLYDYQPGRGGEYPKAFLKGFHGYLQTDGFVSYNGLEKVIRVGCWAHCRRLFDEAMKCSGKGKRSPTAEQGVAYCTQLFKLEKELDKVTPEERYEQRLEKEKPVLDAMLAWANTRTAAPKSSLGKALTYLKNQWEYLNNYLLDSRLELSNNRAERSIKPFVIGRKNWLFANTPKGARSSAVIYSLIETAKENRLDPYRYLCWVLGQAPKLSRSDPEWASRLLPENAPQECRVTKQDN